MRHRYPQSSHRLCSQCSQQYAQSPHIREPHSLHVRAQSSHTGSARRHPHSDEFPSPRSPRIAIRRSRGTVRRTPPTGVRSARTDGRPFGCHGCAPVICHAPMSSCLPDGAQAGPDGRGAAQAAWPVGPVPGPPSAAAPAWADARTLSRRAGRPVMLCARPGRAGSRLRWRDPFSTCPPAVWRGAAADPRALRGRAPFWAATRIRLDRDSQNRYHCFL